MADGTPRIEEPADGPQVATVPVLAAPGDAQVAAGLRGFGLTGALAILVILAGVAVAVPIGAILVLAWAGWSRTPWRDLGFARPRSWAAAVVGGVAFGVVFKLIMKTLVMPLLGAGPTNPAYHDLVGNTAALPGAVLTMILWAGFGEETVFRGYLFERLGRVLGSSAFAKGAMVALTSTLFALAHLHDQKLPGAEQALITGLVFGSIYAVTGRLWMVMCAHAAFDLVSVAIIYLNLEARVAHLFFK